MIGWRRSLCAILAGSFLLLQPGAASAFFSGTGSGSGSSQLPTLVGPSPVTLSQSGTVVTVGWSAATLSTGAAVQGYKVTRSDGATICGSPTLVTTLSCTDSGPPAGTYTYTVKAVFRSWDATATSAGFAILTAPTISSEPANPSNSTPASFSFSGGSGTGYQCQIDGGGYSACASPASYSSLAQGSHTFSVRASSGSSSGPATSYTWTVDTAAPTQSLALASGPSGAYLSGTTLYYRGSAAGSFKVTDTVSDGGSGPASAGFPGIATAGWTHAAETVSTPSGGPYTSSTFSWGANPNLPASYTVTGADAAGNTTTTGLTFVNDSAAPTGGALSVNGTAATAAGSSSQVTNSTSFTIGSRTDYTDAGSGLKSSVLTVQSESLSTAGACGAPGSGGPFTSATTIAGTTQPAGIVAGYCYLYVLTGTDNVGNVASISTTVIDSSVTFAVTSQPTTATAGTAASVTLTAIKNGVTDTSYTGASLTWSGAANSPSGAAPTLPTGPTWTSGVATFSITLVDAQTATLTATDGTRSVTFAPITVSPGSASNVAWTNVSGPSPLPSPCSLTCTYASGFGNSHTWSANVSITDAEGNVVTNVGVGHVVVITLTGPPSGKGSTNPASPATLAIPDTGAATSSTQISYTSVAQGNFGDTLAATSVGYTSATASFAR
jgi:hypothetical protein